MIKSESQPRALIAGGSLGGLSAALFLRRAGWTVDVFERNRSQLSSQGAGIVLQPATLRWFGVTRGSFGPPPISVGANALRYVDRSGTVLYEEPCPWRFTTWTALHRSFLRDLGTSAYHLDVALSSFVDTSEQVEVTLSSGDRVEGDLLVGCDGTASTVRNQLLPGVEPVYAGYVGWRGRVPEARLSSAARAALSDTLTFQALSDSQLISYPIPASSSDDADGGLLNYVFYRNVPASGLDAVMTDAQGVRRRFSVPPGLVSPASVADLQLEATERLAPALAELVNATEHPFIQPIFDLESPRMAVGRVAILGDAAFVARPHAAAGTAKAAENAWALGAALTPNSGGPTAALRHWERGQLRVGRRLVARARAMGERSQHLGTWVPGDPSLVFGLHEARFGCAAAGDDGSLVSEPNA